MTPRPRLLRGRWGAPLALALLAYVPSLATAPGVVAADTKQYLVLDPGRLLATAASLWDPGQFGGHVTHQQIGFLWPMGPWFWLGHAAGVPAWVTQRLWLGTVFLAAGLGMRWLARHLGLGASAALVAAAAYQLSPYVLAYVNRTSGLLLPWAGLPALVVCTMLAVRRPGWRWPAAAGLVVATVGSLNATALVLVAFAPASWLWWAARRGGWPRRTVVAAAARLAACGAVVSCWWAVALAVEGRYGADVLAYSETVRAVSSTASAAEGLRGLGYWLFYGGGVDGPWNSAAPAYLSNPALQALGFALAAAGLVGLVAGRWAARRWLARQSLVGLVLASVAFPPTAASPLGRLLVGARGRSTLVLALRSSTRALPLVALALAAGLGAGFELLVVGRSMRIRWGACAGVVAVLALDLPALWTGGFVDATLRRPANVPEWWRQAAAVLDGGVGRMLELPGQEFAAYRWGTTTDPLLPGLTSRPLLTRDLLPLGSADTMDLLWALDDRLQQGRLEPASVAPVARLLGATDVVARLDAADERYRTPLPSAVLAALDAAPGLGPARAYGPVVARTANPVRIDGRALAAPTSPTPAVVVLPVTGAVAPTRLMPATGTVVLAGNGDGVVDAAAAGLLDGLAPVRYAASLGADEALPEGAPVIVTDTNRRRARQWRGTQDTVGFTEDGGPSPYPTDDADARLPVFPGAGIASETVAVQRGGRVTASAYGEPNAYRPEDRAVFAADGDPSTAWRVADRADPVGARWRIELPTERAVPTVRLVQQQRPANRAVARVVIRSAHGARTVSLDGRSHTPAGQVVPIDDPATSWVEVEIAGTTTGSTPSYFGLDAVGFAEIDAGAVVDEVVRLPTDATDRLAGAPTDRPVVVVLTRDRVDPAERWRGDPEPALARSFRLPSSSATAVRLEARLHQRADDEVLDTLLGAPGGAVVRTSSRLTGVGSAAGAAALDDDPATAWTGAIDDVDGAWWQVTLPAARPIDAFAVRVAGDERHSTPGALLLSIDGATARRVAVAADGTAAIDLGGLMATTVRITVADVAVRGAVDRRYGEAVTLPVGLTDVRFGDEPETPPRRAAIDTGCRTDLVTLDGHPLPVRMQASTADLLAGDAAALVPCGDVPSLATGEHELRAAPGSRTGIDVDRVVVSQGSWNPPAPGAASAGAPTAAALVVRSRGRTSAVLEVPPTDQAQWLVWGQGANDGWRAAIDGHDVGRTTGLVGGGNVWLLAPSTRPRTVHIVWAPQRWVDAGLAVSALGAVACAGAALWPRRRRGLPCVDDLDAGPRRSVGTTAPAPLPALALCVALGVVLHPVYGAAMAVGWWWWRRSGPRAGRAIGALGPALAVAVGGYVVARQVVSRPVAGFGWPLALDAAHRPALAAVALVALHTLGRSR